MIARAADEVIGRIADHLVAQHPAHPLRVAIDGITAAGKTTLAGSLAEAVRARGRAAIHLSMDGFHHPRAHRHRQGRDSAVGYYQNAYDMDSFARLVLTPLGPGGDHRYLAHIIDLATDQPTDAEPLRAPSDAVVLVDGSFLQRTELAGRWDEVVFLDTSIEAARTRGTRRDAEAFGGVARAEAAYVNRYHAASRIYLEQVDPAAHASILVTNDDVMHPVLQRIGGTVGSTVGPGS